MHSRALRTFGGLRWQFGGFPPAWRSRLVEPGGRRFSLHQPHEKSAWELTNSLTSLSRSSTRRSKSASGTETGQAS